MYYCSLTHTKFFQSKVFLFPYLNQSKRNLFTLINKIDFYLFNYLIYFILKHRIIFIDSDLHIVYCNNSSRLLLDCKDMNQLKDVIFNLPNLKSEMD